METLKVKDVKELQKIAQNLSDQLSDLLVPEACVVIGMLTAQSIATLAEEHGPEAAMDWLKSVFKTAGITAIVKPLYPENERMN